MVAGGAFLNRSRREAVPGRGSGERPPAEGETGVQDRWPSWIFPKFTTISRGFFRDLRLAFSAPEEIDVYYFQKKSYSLFL
jgi:hypothetical protein